MLFARIGFSDSRQNFGVKILGAKILGAKNWGKNTLIETHFTIIFGCLSSTAGRLSKGQFLGFWFWRRNTQSMQPCRAKHAAQVRRRRRKFSTQETGHHFDCKIHRTSTGIYGQRTVHMAAFCTDRQIEVVRLTDRRFAPNQPEAYRVYRPGDGRFALCASR